MQAASIGDLESSETKKYAPIHIKIHNALKNSSKLKPIHIKVKNDSYWYLSRKRLCPRRHIASIAKENGVRFESYIFKMKERKSDYEIVPQRVLVKYDCNTKLDAIRFGENQCRERDANPGENAAVVANVDPNNLLATHFRITVVSAKFDRLTNVQRLALVYEVLLEELGVQAAYDDTNDTDPSVSEDKRALRRKILGPPTNMKMFSTIGKNICNLHFLRYLLPESYPFELTVEAVTPSQWKPANYPAPLSERMGTTHVSINSHHLPREVMGDAQMNRIKNLTKQSGAAERQQQLSGKGGASHKSKSGAEIADGLGVDPVVSGIIYKQTGGVYGHPFKDLESGIRERILLTHKDNKKLIQREGYFVVPIKEPGAIVKEKDTMSVTGSLQGFPLAITDNIDKDMQSVASNESMGSMDKSDTDVEDDDFSLAGSVAGSLATPSTPIGHSKRGKKPSDAMSTTSSKMSSKVSTAATKVRRRVAEYDKGTTTEEEMVEEIAIRARKIEKYVVRIQRIFRMCQFPKAIRWYWRRQFALLTIQRVIRGHFGREYFNLLARLAPMAATRIQRCFRAFKSRQIMKMWRYLVRRMTRVILPKIKLFLKNCYESWLRKHSWCANSIQAAVRMHIVRTRYKKLLGESLYLTNLEGRSTGYGIFDEHAIVIQRCIRGRWGRKIGVEKLIWTLHWKIEQPASVCIQRVYRGHVARLVARHERYKRRMRRRVQRFGRKLLQHLWKIRSDRAKLVHRSAREIQRHYRARIDKEIVTKRRAVRYYNTVYIPSIVRVQSVIRMSQQRDRFITLLRQTAAATFIQGSFRRYKERIRKHEEWLRKIADRKRRMAAMIQKTVRMFIVRCSYKKEMLARAGKRILAGKVIIRAWRYYVAAKRLQMLLDENRVAYISNKNIVLRKSREDIEEDIREIKVDLDNVHHAVDRLKRRLKAVSTFVVEANLRIPVLQDALANLTTEDFELGWAESYGQEYESLNHQSSMANEEIRLIENMLWRKKIDIQKLQFEWEEMEWELDGICSLDIANCEAARRAEVGMIERRVTDQRKREIREEVCRWKIDSVRVNVLHRNRKGYKALALKSKEKRNSEYAQTVSFEKRQQQRDLEELNLQYLIEKDDGRRLNLDKKGYEEYGGPVQESYDAVVTNSLSLLRGMTLDERAARVKEYYRQDEIDSKKSLGGGQFAPLKTENQPQGYHDKL